MRAHSTSSPPRTKSNRERTVAPVLFSLIVVIASHGYLYAQQAWQAEWDKTLAAAKKEGKVVVGLPPSAELRRELEPAFKARFGFEMEIFLPPGRRSLIAW